MKTKSSADKRLKILIVEDSPTQAELLRFLLDVHGYDVVTVTNAKSALNVLRTDRPVLVISDIVMPEMNGYELCKIIKSDDDLKSIPVILVTRLADSDDVVNSLECGADNFIRKPYEENYLLSRIDYLLTNIHLRKNQKTLAGVEIVLCGRKHLITAERPQILDLFISTYEQAIQVSNELQSREKDLAYSNQILRGLYRIAEALNQVSNEHEVAEIALTHILELPDIQAGWIFLRAEASHYKLAAARNLPPALERDGAFDLDCLCRRESVGDEFRGAINIFECAPLAMAYGDAHEMHRHAGVPLWIGDRRLGQMNLIGTGQKLFDKDELQMLYSIGKQIAAALERTHLNNRMEQFVAERTAKLSAEVSWHQAHEARITRVNRIHRVLSGINTALVRVRTAQELVETACRIAVDPGQFTLTWIGMLNENGYKIVPVAKAGYDDDHLSQINLSIREEDLKNCRLTVEAMKHALPVICNDIATDARVAVWRDAALDRGYRSVALFPLLLDSQAIGVFVLYAPEANMFGADEVTLLTEVARDISFALVHLKKEQRLRDLAYFDAVTDLPHRMLFLDRIEQRCHSTHHDQTLFSIIVIGLDRFDRIHESFGQPAEDNLLRQVAQRLKQTLDATFILARLPSDAFGIATLHDNDEDDDVFHVIEQILSTIHNQPFFIAEQALHVSAKAGASRFPVDGRNAEPLLRDAEAALKRARLLDEPYLLYNSAFDAPGIEMSTFENKLRRALEQNQFLLHYQPKIDLSTRKISGLEALLRWDDPETGIVLPLMFIPLLEETGLIIEVGRWVLAKVVSDANAWQVNGLHPPRIGVNVSSIQLQQKDFANMVAGVIRHSENAFIKLELGITESVIVQEIATNIQKLHTIREMGVEIAIDHFGTDYASRSSIAKLPVNTLKINRALIAGMDNHSDDLSSVSTLITLAHSLNRRVVAEGVETQQQAHLLRRLKCDEIQGFLFSPAVDAQQIETFLRENKTLETQIT